MGTPISEHFTHWEIPSTAFQEDLILFFLVQIPTLFDELIDETRFSSDGIAGQFRPLGRRFSIPFEFFPLVTIRTLGNVRIHGVQVCVIESIRYVPELLRQTSMVFQEFLVCPDVKAVRVLFF